MDADLSQHWEDPSSPRCTSPTASSGAPPPPPTRSRATTSASTGGCTSTSTKTTIVEPSADAADRYHRYREDIGIAADLGLSPPGATSGARIEPECGHVSRTEIDHHRRMVEACHEAGIEPIVTLMHSTVPRWSERDGFWRAPDAADLSARDTEAALPVVQDGVRSVCTINEANLVAYGLPNPDLGVADALLASHRRSRDVLSPVSGLQSGYTIATQAFTSSGEPWRGEMLREYGYPGDDWYLEQVSGARGRRGCRGPPRSGRRRPR